MVWLPNWHPRPLKRRPALILTHYRIARIDLKDFNRQGYLTTELRSGDETYLTDLAKRIDKIIGMKTT